MKVSYNWLKNYVDFNLTASDLGEVLTGVGLEVEDITVFETIQGGLQGIVIGEVIECAKHPDADKLSVTKVNIGAPELLQIVCGAPNVAAGQKVVVATVGSTLYPTATDKLQIKKAKIRGVESMGMLCAEDEIGLGQSHAGIMVLPAETPIGMFAADYFKVEKDFVIEIGLTPNRGDANSHLGVARDLATALNVTYKAKVNFTKPDIAQFPNIADACKIKVQVLDSDACPRYSAVSISNITVADSPSWLKNKLKAIGVRSVNNVVDIINYVLHESGQPLHAFDADKIKGDISVKKLAEGTLFRTLDDKEIKLSANDLMICDENGGLCIAGVFGGLSSGVTQATTNLFLESAYFSATGIRKTGTRLGLRTDAAMHFEKGTDPNGTVDALKRAALLITEICGGQISSAIIDLYPSKVEGWRINISYSRILKLAGFAIELDTIKQILTHLEIKIESEKDGDLALLVPAFKTDVKREADIVEEIIRILGYNSFALPKGLKSSLSHSPKVDAQKMENTIADMLSGAGFNEIWTNSVTQSKFEEDETLKQQQVKLLNSQTTELDALRTSMLYSSLEVVAYNQNRKATDLRLYEFGRTYHKVNNTYQQTHHLQLIITGKSAEDNWLQKGAASSFYHLKAYVTNILNRLGHSTFEQEIIETAPFNFALILRSVADISSNEKGVEVARLGSISKQVLSKFDIKSEVFFADINWGWLVEKSQFVKVAFSELPKFPAVKRDLAMLVNTDLQFQAIEKIAILEAKKLLQEISLFDVYKGHKIEAGKKSYAVSFVFQNKEKTLTDQEVEKVMAKLMAKFESELGAIIRKG